MLTPSQKHAHEANATQGAANERLYGADSNSKSVMIKKVRIAVPNEELLEQTVLDEGTKELVMTLDEQGWSNKADRTMKLALGY